MSHAANYVSTPSSDCAVHGCILSAATIETMIIIIINI